MLRLLAFLTLSSCVLASAAVAQGSPPAQMDSLLNRLTGDWRMSGSVRGRPVTYSLRGTRVLQGRFVHLHMTALQQPPGYEAEVFIGVDSARAQYVAHWLDNSGAAYSIPHATGTAQGDTIRLAFEYADGPFRDTFVYRRATRTWYFRLESQDSSGSWQLFAEYNVSPQP
jgi:hypothetical protein